MRWPLLARWACAQSSTQRDTSLRAQSEPRIHLADLAVKMHQQHSPRARRNAALHAVYTEQRGPWVDVGQYRHRTGAQNGEHRGECRHRRGDDFVAGANANRAQCDLDRVHTVANTNAMAHTATGGPQVLEGLDFLAQHIPARVDHASGGQRHRIAQSDWFGLEVIHHDHVVASQ